MNPLRHFVVGPALEVGSHILPAVAKVAPPLDPIMSSTMNFTFDFARHVYHKTHNEQFNADWKTFRDAQKEFESFADPKRLKDIEIDDPEKNFILASLRCNIGFAVHDTVNFFSDPMYNLQVWSDYTKKLAAYCKSAGIDHDLLKPILSDKFVFNARILGRVQKENDNTDFRRMRTMRESHEVASKNEITDVAVVAK